MEAEAGSAAPALALPCRPAAACTSSARVPRRPDTRSSWHLSTGHWASVWRGRTACLHTVSRLVEANAKKILVVLKVTSGGAFDVHAMSQKWIANARW